MFGYNYEVWIQYAKEDQNMNKNNVYEKPSLFTSAFPLPFHYHKSQPSSPTPYIPSLISSLPTTPTNTRPRHRQRTPIILRMHIPPRREIRPRSTIAIIHLTLIRIARGGRVGWAKVRVRIDGGAVGGVAGCVPGVHGEEGGDVEGDEGYEGVGGGFEE